MQSPPVSHPTNPLLEGQGWWEAEIKKKSNQGGRDEPRGKPWITVCQLLESGKCVWSACPFCQLYKSKLTICAANKDVGKHPSESAAKMELHLSGSYQVFRDEVLQSHGGENNL